ncbi:MAG TPA: hypothetical protein VHC43_13725 [Mycobacteriales bacterium]|nr:hypothetical protein [Mycobacteriales bacterium]
MTTATLTGFLIFGASVWVGGLIAIAIVARVATGALEPPVRVAFFRDLGRVYGIAGTAALALAYGTGAALLVGRAWSGPLIAAVVIAALLAATLAVGVAQARRMTRLRRRSLELLDDVALAGSVRRGSAVAHALRACIAVLSLALMALGIALGA